MCLLFLLLQVVMLAQEEARRCVLCFGWLCGCHCIVDYDGAATVRMAAYRFQKAAADTCSSSRRCCHGIISSLQQQLLWQLPLAARKSSTMIC
jgi:hypothetical protein